MHDVELVQQQSQECDNREDWLSDAHDKDPCLVDLTSVAHSITGLSSRETQKQLAHYKRKSFSLTLALKSKEKQLRSLTGPMYRRLLKNDSLCYFYTGIPTTCIKVFEALVSYFKDKEKQHQTTKKNASLKIRRHKRPAKPSTLYSQLCTKDQLLLCLMNLKLGLLHRDLAERYVLYHPE